MSHKIGMLLFEFLIVFYIIFTLRKAIVFSFFLTISFPAWLDSYAHAHLCFLAFAAAPSQNHEFVQVSSIGSIQFDSN